jgi:hypothetical protein
LYLLIISGRRNVNALTKQKGADTMTKTMTFAVALALVLVAVMIAAAGINFKSSADAAALPLAVTPGIETPVRATKGDRLDARTEFRVIAGVTVVLRDFSRVVR